MRAVAAMTAAVMLAGCHADMYIQPKMHKPFQQSDFFADGQSSRSRYRGPSLAARQNSIRLTTLESSAAHALQSNRCGGVGGYRNLPRQICDRAAV